MGLLDEVAASPCVLARAACISSVLWSDAKFGIQMLALGDKDWAFLVAVGEEGKAAGDDHAWGLNEDWGSFAHRDQHMG